MKTSKKLDTKEKIYDFIVEIAKDLNVYDKFIENYKGKESLRSKLNKIDINYKPDDFNLFDKESFKRIKVKDYTEEIKVPSDEAEIEIVE